MAWRDGTVSAQDGKRLYFRDYGPRFGGAVPVVCLGGLTRTSHDFHRVASRLAATRRVICPDYRGRGRSDRDRNWRNYAPPQLLLDLSALLTALGLDGGVAVIGTSFGGLLAMALAVARPTVVKGVVLNDVGPEIENHGLARIKSYVCRDRPQPDWNCAVAELKRMSPDLEMGSPEGWLDFARGTWRRGDDGLLHFDFDIRLAKTLKAGPIPDLWPLFKALRSVPVAAIRGGQSDVLSAATLAHMQAVHPDMIAVTIDGVGHAPHLDEPASREAIDALLARL